MEVEVFEERQAQFFSGKDPANCYRAAFPHCCGPGAESGKEQLELVIVRGTDERTVTVEL